MGSSSKPTLDLIIGGQVGPTAAERGDEPRERT
jgi:hypothetical protein